MTRWFVWADSAHDAVFGLADVEDGTVRDVVPVTEWLDLHVDRRRSERLLGFSIEGASGHRSTGFDLRWFSRVAGRPLADAVWTALAAEDLRSVRDDSGFAIEVEVANDERRALRRLNYLYNVVQTAGWVGDGGWQMANGWTVSDVLGPLDVGPDAMGAADWIARQLLEGGTEGRADARVRDLERGGGVGGGGINLIPSDRLGPCSPVLMALCFDADNLERRLNDAVKHAGIHCPATRAVIFITSKWDPKAWGSIERDVEALGAMFVVMMRGPSGQLARLR